MDDTRARMWCGRTSYHLHGERLHALCTNSVQCFQNAFCERRLNERTRITSYSDVHAGCTHFTGAHYTSGTQSEQLTCDNMLIHAFRCFTISAGAVLKKKKCIQKAPKFGVVCSVFVFEISRRAITSSARFVP